MINLYLKGTFDFITLKEIKYLNNIDFKKYKSVTLLIKKSKVSFNAKLGVLMRKLAHFNAFSIKWTNSGVDGKIIDMDAKFPSKVRDLSGLDIIDFNLNYLMDNHLYIFDKIYKLEGEKRYYHSVSVAKTAIEIAKANNIDPYKPFVAAILHDISKNLSGDAQLKIMKKYFARYLNRNHGLHHQFTGAYVANKNFNIKSKEILNAIKYHTIGHAKMSTLDKIIYAADKIEPTRGYDSKYMIDACLDDINKGFKLVVEENVKFLTKQNIEIDPLTIKMMNNI